MESANPFLQEGIAIAVDELAFGKKLRENDQELWPDEYVKYSLKSRTSLPRLTEVMLFDGFNKYPNELVVPMAASWFKYLWQTYGSEKCRSLFVSMTELMDAEEIDGITMRIFDKTVSSLQNDWELSLNDTP